MRIATVPINALKPAGYSPRADLKPGDPEYERIARSIREFGLVEPLILNERTGNLVGGHQRLKVLLAQGASEVEVSVVDLSPEKEKALNVALNKVSGRWDHDKLGELLGELVADPELDVTITGFELPEAKLAIGGLLPTESGEPAAETFDVDSAVETAEAQVPITQPGDLIELGRHRLLCGDSTEPAQVRALMEGRRAVLMATDPPYLVGYDGSNRPGKKRRPPPARESINWDDAAQTDLYDKFLTTALAEAIDPRCAIYIWHASRRQAMLDAALTRAGVLIHQALVWAKPNAVRGRSWYGWAHEPCLFGWLQSHKPKRVSKEAVSTVWELPPVGRGSTKRPDHPTPKPLGVFEIPMKMHTEPGELCFEPFAGSGTQIIAAERMNRVCYAVEKDPRYCDLIVRRYIAYAGENAVHPDTAAKYCVDDAAEKGVAA